MIAPICNDLQMGFLLSDSLKNQGRKGAALALNIPVSMAMSRLSVLLNSEFRCDMNILVTGGAGFIGSALVKHLVLQAGCNVLNVDCLTYAGNLGSLHDVDGRAGYRLSRTDIRDADALLPLFDRFQPDAVMHLAAESHVDRSIAGPGAFVQTNVVGTANMLEAARHYWNGLSAERQNAFRFLQVSTDEVFGDLPADALPFTESSPFVPSSPYSASKAGADHLAKAWYKTFGLPVLVTHCSNNYGPFHHPEKLIPRMILNALHGRPLPVYGNGLQRRDWLFVDDHVRALLAVLQQGQVGESYNIGGGCERTNLEVVEGICNSLQALGEATAFSGAYRDLITFVQDRPGHDVRYAVDASRIHRELGWQPEVPFETGLRATVHWYLAHQDWWAPLIT